MFRNMYRNILLDVPSNFGSSFFSYKTAEATNINIFTSGQSIFHFFEHSFKSNKYIHFGNTCFFRYLVYEVSFSHLLKF